LLDSLFSAARAVPHLRSPNPAKPQQLRLAVLHRNATQHALVGGQDKKIFDKYGLDVQLLIFVMGGALVTQMLPRESSDRRHAPAALLGLVAGQKNCDVYRIMHTSPFTLISQQHQSRSRSEGKTPRHARFGGSSHVSALIALDYLKARSEARQYRAACKPAWTRNAWQLSRQKGLDAAMLQRLATKPC